MEPMILADIAGYNLVLRMPWLQQHNSAMRWFNHLWRLSKGNEITLGQTAPDHIALINADSFHSIVDCKRLIVFSIQATLLHHPGTDQRSNGVLATMIVADISRIYHEYAQIFDEVAANKLSKHGPHDHAIDLAGTETPPFWPLYNLSTNKLKAL